MKIELKPLFRVCKAALNSSNPADFALLKAVLLGAKANPAIAHALEPMRGYYPAIDLTKLIALPQGSLGYEYALYMQLNKLQPLQISAELEEIARRNTFAFRYIVTHDLFHVLLDFDTSYAGEIGVLAFAVAQQYSRWQNIGLHIAKYLYPLLSPRQSSSIAANLRRGKQLGQTANFLLNYPFEANWHRPLTELRRELSIELNGSEPRSLNCSPK